MRQLRAAGHGVVVLNNRSSGHAGALPEDVELVRAALLDLPGVRAALEAHTPDAATYNVAAWATRRRPTAPPDRRDRATP